MEEGVRAAVRVPFPADGPPSPVLATVYPNPGRVYLTAFCFWSSLTVFRWKLMFLGSDTILYWNAIDCVLALIQALWVVWHLLRSHHRWRYLNCKPRGDVKPEDITHVLTVLHATEPAEQLDDIVTDLKSLCCKGRKILILGMEAKTPDLEDRVAAIMKAHGDGFDEILYTVHTLRNGEIVGTGSNHYECQVAAQVHLKGTDTSNVIFSKFDTNMRLDKDGLLLQEIESVWCMVEPEERKGMTFMPNVYWAAASPDGERNCMEKFVSFSMSTLLQQSSFSMAFVSGSFEGVCEIGYTPPSLLAEDDLTFSKKQALLRKPRTYRLCSAILKVFASSPATSKRQWTIDFLDKKMKRWMMGHVEKDVYMLTWLFFRKCLVDFGAPHPAIKNPLRCIGCLFLSILRMYMIFALPLNMVPCIYGVLPHYMNESNFEWVTLLQVLPQYLPGLKFRVPTLVIEGSQTNALHYFLLAGYWALLPAAFICICIMFGIQVRIYRSFKFLRFSFWTLLLYPVVFSPVMLALGPVFLLWSFLKHGCLNAPAGHVMVSTKQAAPVCDGDKSKGDSDEPEDLEASTMSPSVSISDFSSQHDDSVFAL